MAELTLPSEAYKESFIAAVREFQAEGRALEFDVETLGAQFASYVRWLRAKHEKTQVGRIPEMICWLVEDGEFIGRASIRHDLTTSTEQIGGHISYEIRPSKRRRGYGTLILKLALDEARQIGLRRALVTCDDDNIGSAKIIEANGGQLQDVIDVDGHPARVRRYWIEIE